MLTQADLPPVIRDCLEESSDPVLNRVVVAHVPQLTAILMMQGAWRMDKVDAIHDYMLLSSNGIPLMYKYRRQKVTWFDSYNWLQEFGAP